MINRPPPLKALRAFEAAARHLSLSKAADELFVSAGAVSQQVKLLEGYLSTPLFERQHRQITLTDAGNALFPGITAAFDQINQTVNRVIKLDQNKPLTVSAAPSIAGKWLVPRLQAFYELHPEIDVRIDTSTFLSDLAHSDIDVGIRFGSGNYPGLRTDFLTCVEVLPVCAPSMIKPEHPLHHPDDLRHYQLLHYDYPEEVTNWPDWEMWLAAAGSRGVDFSRGLRFRENNLVMDAALRGQGVALTSHLSAQDALDDGSLIKPFDLAIPQDFAYYLVSLASTADEPRISAFRTWLLEEIVKSGKIC